MWYPNQMWSTLYLPPPTAEQANEVGLLGPCYQRLEYIVLMFNILMVLTVKKMLIMTLLRIVPRPWNEPEVEVVAEVAVYCNHSEARVQLGCICIFFIFSSCICMALCLCIHVSMLIPEAHRIQWQPTRRAARLEARVRSTWPGRSRARREGTRLRNWRIH